MKETHAEATLGTYLIIWVSLLALTAVTVVSASLDLGKAAIVIVLAIAAGKSTLVVLFFMHLRYEKRILIRILIPISLAILAIFIGLTYTDIIYRQGG